MIVLLMPAIAELESRLPASYRVKSATKKRGRWVVRCIKDGGQQA